MAPSVASAALLFVALRMASAAADGVTPVQKVIEMLTDMKAKGMKEKQAEEVAYAKFKQFCTGETANKENEIKKTEELVGVLAAEADKLDSDAAELADEIDTLQQEVAKHESAMKEATASREADKASNEGEIKEFAEGVDALERAIAVLQKQAYDRKQAATVLLQLSHSPKLPASTRRAVVALLELHESSDETQPDELFHQAPEANAYEFQSGGIVDMLKKLREEMRGQLGQSQKEEMNAQHAYELMSQDLHDSVENAKSDISSKTVDKEQKVQAAAETRKELGAAKSDLEEATAYLKDLKAECDEKGRSFEEKQALRAGEIEAIQKAIEILSSPEVSGNSEKYRFLQKAGKSLLQVHSDSSPGLEDVVAEDTRRRLLQFLAQQGQSLHSPRLGLIAQSAASDPFAKVKKMIDEMITRLMQESLQETEQKGFCDKELGTNKQTRDKLNSDIDDLSAGVDEATATIAQLGQELASLSQGVAELNVAIQESTAARDEEKARNEVVIKDAKEAQAAVEAATQIIKDFYEKAGKATALLQKRTSLLATGSRRPKMGSPEWEALANPNFEGEIDPGHKAGEQTFGEVYKGQQDGAGSVLAMLEVIASDFATLLAETEADEAEAQSLYEEFMAESKKSVSVKEKQIELLGSDKISKEAELVSMKKDLASNQDQLLAADRYYEKLKPQCVDSGITYEERAKARQAEIESLQEALKILSGEDIA